ncbi:MAG: YqaE/Pmp3 family membrane protein [Dysgonamonadaceae bacterium]|nr:YqaE/Pmp3 family membrane protein [Dysgonamonadaceae bacterium]MDD4727659.1 YqaE/Pmp3 family membrane protein [Dysgonamonadaceae bacterium]
MTLLTILLSVLLPPLAVFLKRGVGTPLLINILLTILGWVPGVVHALYVNQKGTI